MRPKTYRKSITFRLTDVGRDYIAETAKLQRMSMTQFLRNLLRVHHQQMLRASREGQV